MKTFNGSTYNINSLKKGGITTFKGWAFGKQGAKEFYTKFLGEFNPDMTAEEANDILHKNKITKLGQEEFMDGWREAQKEYKEMVAKGINLADSYNTRGY